MRKSNFKILLLVILLLISSINLVFADIPKEGLVVENYEDNKDKDYKLLDGNEDNDLFKTTNITNQTYVIGETKLLKDLPNGSIVYDKSWTWDHRIGDGYTNVGEVKPIDWIIVSKNHLGYPDNSITLLSNEIISKYYFDNSLNRGSNEGSNHYGNSGNPNATAGIRPFLNTTLYNTFSNKFKEIVLETTVNMRATDGGSYVLKDKVLLPSVNEVGGISTTSDGTNWGYFNDNESRISNINKINTDYWTRTPYSVNSNEVYYVSSEGDINYNRSASSSGIGVRPIINIKSDVLVKLVENNRWEIEHIKDDIEAPTLELTPSTTGPTKQDITIIATATDVINPNSIVSGVKRIQKPDGQWVDGSTVSYNVTINGTYTFKVEDNAGNVGTKSIVVNNINKTKPKSPVIKVSTTEKTNKDILANIEYSEDSVSKLYKVGSSEWRSYEGPFIVSNNSTIYAKGVNNVEVSSDESNVIINNIDKTKPNTPTLTASTTSPTNKDVTVTINSNNGNTGKLEYRVNSGSWMIYTSPILVSRNCIVESRFTSEVGNISNIGFIDITNINKYKPVIEIEDYDEEPTSEPVTVYATVDSGTLNSTSHTFTKNGSFTFIAKNEYGSTSELTVRIRHIDETLPTKGEIIIIALDEDKNEIEVTEKKDLKLGRHTIKAPEIEGYEIKGSKSTTVTLKASDNSIEVKFNYILDSKFKEAKKSIEELEKLVRESENKRTIESKELSEKQLDKSYKLIDKLTRGTIKDDLNKEYDKLKDRISRINIIEVPKVDYPSLKVTSDNFISRYKDHIVISKEPINVIYKEIVKISLTNEDTSNLRNNSLIPKIHRWDESKGKWISLSTKVEGNNISTYESVKGYVAVYGINQPKFNDVKESDWFFKYIDRANGLSIIEGSIDKDGNRVVKPNDYISRSELYTIVARLFGAVPRGQSTLYNELNYITEENGNTWYKPYLQEYVNKGVITRMITEKEAKEVIDREEVVLLLTKMLELVENIDYININNYKDTKGMDLKIANIIKGYEDNTLRLNNKITRAEAMTLIINAIEGLGW